MGIHCRTAVVLRPSHSFIDCLGLIEPSGYWIAVEVSACA